MKVQVDYTPEKVTFYRNGDSHFQGYQVIITHRNFKNWEQLLTYISQHLNLQSGSIRMIFSLNGTIINELQGFEDGGSYVCSHGEEFIDMMYGKQLAVSTNTSSKSRGKEIVEDRTNSYFTQDSKSINVFAALNGSVDEAKKFILNYRNCKNIDQLYEMLTSSLAAKEPITFIVDYSTKLKLPNLSLIQEKSCLIACTRTFNDLQYRFPLTETVGTVIPKSKIITVFPNGNEFHIGIKITITHHKFKTIDKLLEVLSDKLRDQLARVNILYGFLPQIVDIEKQNMHRGVAFLPKHVFKVKELSELMDGQYYVACSSDEPFRANIKYNIDSIESGLKNKLSMAKQKPLFSQRSQVDVVISAQLDVTQNLTQQVTTTKSSPDIKETSQVYSSNNIQQQQDILDS